MARAGPRQLLAALALLVARAQVLKCDLTSVVLRSEAVFGQTQQIPMKRQEKVAGAGWEADLDYKYDAVVLEVRGNASQQNCEVRGLESSVRRIKPGATAHFTFALGPANYWVDVTRRKGDETSLWDLSVE